MSKKRMRVVLETEHEEINVEPAAELFNEAVRQLKQLAHEVVVFEFDFDVEPPKAAPKAAPKAEKVPAAKKAPESPLAALEKKLEAAPKPKKKAAPKKKRAPAKKKR